MGGVDQADGRFDAAPLLRSVVDASHILTAAHCVYNQNGVPAQAGFRSPFAPISNCHRRRLHPTSNRIVR